MATYKYIVTEILLGVQRQSTNPPSQDRIRTAIDAAWFAVNSQTAQAYASTEARREMLRVNRTITFTAGDAAVPDNTLKSFMEDCTLTITGKKYSFRRYPEWLRTGDPRLGYWTEIGDTLKAKTPAPVTTYSGSAEFSSIEAPEVPDTEDDEVVAPADFIPDFIDAMTNYVLQGITINIAAEATVA